MVLHLGAVNIQGEQEQPVHLCNNVLLYTKSGEVHDFGIFVKIIADGLREWCRILGSKYTEWAETTCAPLQECATVY